MLQYSFVLPLIRPDSAPYSLHDIVGNMLCCLNCILLGFFLLPFFFTHNRYSFSSPLPLIAPPYIAKGSS